MTSRSLRVIVALTVVFIGFLYLASLQVKDILPVKCQDEGQIGGPVAGLTRWQLSQFEEGRQLFQKKFSVADGLGPLYNAQSCADCHGGRGAAVAGSAADSSCSYTTFARRKAGSRFEKEPAPSVKVKIESSDLDLMEGQGGPVLVGHSIKDLKPAVLPADCKLETTGTVPAAAEYRSTLYAPPLYGLGLVNVLYDQLINSQVYRETQLVKTQHGRTNRGASRIWQQVGRFGAKCQDASLYECLSRELGVQIGITNPLFRHEVSAKGDGKFPPCVTALCPAVPNSDGVLLNKLNFYLSLLSPPPRGAIDKEVCRGELLFQKAGCAVCHLPALRTPDKVYVINPDGPALQTTEVQVDPKAAPMLQVVSEPKYIELRALEKKPVQAYSDFLLHDMGKELSDGIAAPGTTGGEWRTTPLWGLRLRKFYLHDGRARKLEDAIKLHGGQALDSAKAYAKLSESEKKSLLAFLNSL